MGDYATSQSGLEIAIIGMAGRFPGAQDIEAFWQNLRNGAESIAFFTDQEMEAAGASEINGTTDFDRTNYFETLPSNQLELALWLESDRMGFLLDCLDEEKLENQRSVVRNERRQNIESGLNANAGNH